MTPRPTPRVTTTSRTYEVTPGMLAQYMGLPPTESIARVTPKSTGSSTILVYTTEGDVGGR